MEHNHQYVFVKKVILQTDQRALVFIMPKPLASAPKKLECLVTTSYQPLPFRSRSATQWNWEREICDPTLHLLKSKILNGFPDTKDDLPAMISYNEIMSWETLQRFEGEPFPQDISREQLNRGANKAQGWSMLHMDSANTNHRHSLMSGFSNQIPCPVRAKSHKISTACMRMRRSDSTQGQFSTLNTEHLHP